MGEFFFGLFFGVGIGIVIVCVALNILNEDERDACRQKHNVWSCEFKGEWVPSTPPA
jgi:hypothetical protein